MSPASASLDDLAARLFDGPNFAHIATLLSDGSPHVVPVWMARDGDRLLMVKLERSVGLRNIERDPRVSISITDHEDPYVSAHVRGRAVAVERGEAAVHWLHVLARRHTGKDHPEPLPAVALVTVEPTKVVSVHEEGYG